MKLSKLQKLAWVFFALALATTSVYSQNWRNGNRNVQNQNGTCLNYISDLTEKQQKQILELEEKHQEEMAELRNQRRATFDAIEKNEIRGEMLKKVKAHRNAAKNFLNENQQKQYDQLHSFGFYGRGQNFANRNGNGNFKGRGMNGGKQQFAGGNRGGRCYANGNNYGRGYGRSYNSGNRNCFRNGNGYGAGFNNRGNNFSARRSNFGRGYGNSNTNGNRKFYWQNNGAGSEDIGNEGPEVIEEK
ncbi:Spy/CpxP family protein refolding chaperone [Draconibacterium sp.]|nr:Spy/CpxP family protein refolding chaperone [Draconibacterium sp.]